MANCAPGRKCFSSCLVVQEDIALGRPTAAEFLGFADAAAVEEGESPASSSSPRLRYLQASVESGIAAGFQIATANGPLCAEPMWGVAFEVSSLQ